MRANRYKLLNAWWSIWGWFFIFKSRISSNFTYQNVFIKITFTIEGKHRKFLPMFPASARLQVKVFSFYLICKNKWVAWEQTRETWMFPISIMIDIKKVKMFCNLWFIGARFECFYSRLLSPRKHQLNNWYWYFHNRLSAYRQTHCMSFLKSWQLIRNLNINYSIFDLFFATYEAFLICNDVRRMRKQIKVKMDFFFIYFR